MFNLSHIEHCTRGEGYILICLCRCIYKRKGRLCRNSNYTYTRLISIYLCVVAFVEVQDSVVACIQPRTSKKGGESSKSKTLEGTSYGS